MEATESNFFMNYGWNIKKKKDSSGNIFKNESNNYGGDIFKFITKFLESTKKSLHLNESFPETVYHNTWNILSDNLKSAENFKVNLNNYLTALNTYINNLMTLEGLFSDYCDNLYDTSKGVNIKDCVKDISEKLSANKIFDSDSWKARANNVGTLITTLASSADLVKSKISQKKQLCNTMITNVEKVIQQIDARLNLLSKIYSDHHKEYENGLMYVEFFVDADGNVLSENKENVAKIDHTEYFWYHPGRGEKYSDKNVALTEGFIDWWNYYPYCLTGDDKEMKIGTTRSN